MPSLNTITIKESVATRKVIAELNKSYELSFNHSFTESLLKHCSESECIMRKESAVVKKRKRRDMQRNVCSAMNKAFAENAALSFLADNESFSGYQHERLAQSFEQVETPRPKK